MEDLLFSCILSQDIIYVQGSFVNPEKHEVYESWLHGT